jgi:hypothetical protein
MAMVMLTVTANTRGKTTCNDDGGGDEDEDHDDDDDGDDNGHDDDDDNGSDYHEVTPGNERWNTCYQQLRNAIQYNFILTLTWYIEIHSANKYLFITPWFYMFAKNLL